MTELTSSCPFARITSRNWKYENNISEGKGETNHGDLADLVDEIEHFGLRNVEFVDQILVEIGRIYHVRGDLQTQVLQTGLQEVARLKREIVLSCPFKYKIKIDERGFFRLLESSQYVRRSYKLSSLQHNMIFFPKIYKKSLLSRIQSAYFQI